MQDLTESLSFQTISTSSLIMLLDQFIKKNTFHIQCLQFKSHNFMIIHLNFENFDIIIILFLINKSLVFSQLQKLKITVLFRQVFNIAQCIPSSKVCHIVDFCPISCGLLRGFANLFSYSEFHFWERLKMVYI